MDPSYGSASKETNKVMKYDDAFEEKGKQIHNEDHHKTRKQPIVVDGGKKKASIRSYPNADGSVCYLFKKESVVKVVCPANTDANLEIVQTLYSQFLKEANMFQIQEEFPQSSLTERAKHVANSGVVKPNSSKEHDSGPRSMVRDPDQSSHPSNSGDGPKSSNASNESGKAKPFISNAWQSKYPPPGNSTPNEESDMMKLVERAKRGANIYDITPNPPQYLTCEMYVPAPPWSYFRPILDSNQAVSKYNGVSLPNM